VTLRRSGKRGTEKIVRLTLFLLPLLFLLSATSSAQTPSPMDGSPGAMTSPSAGPGGSMMGPHMKGGPCPFPPQSGFYPHRHPAVLVAGLILKALLTLSAIFALTALGIFLIRRSRPHP